MSRYRWHLTFTLTIVAAVALIATAGTAGPAVTAADLVSVLADEQQPADIPDVLPDRQVPIDPTSTRLLGRDGRGRYWVATDERRNLCLLVQLDDGGDDWVISATCAPTAEVARRDVWLEVSLNGTGVAATLAPDARADAAAAGMTTSSRRIGRNVLVRDISG